MIQSICCVGAGYVGGPTAAVIALQNPHIRVTVVDRDPSRIRRWMSRHPPIYEPGLADIVRVARDGSREFTFSNERYKSSGSSDSEDFTASTDSSECGSQCDGHNLTVPERQPNLFFSTDVAGCIREADVVLIAVNTSTKTRGIGAGSATDMTAFEAVTAEVARHAKPGAIIVEKSTVPCRTAELVRETLSLHRPDTVFEVLSNPEFLAAGTAVSDLLHPDRILIGSSPTPAGQYAAGLLAAVYAAWVPRSRIITTNIFSSELAKLVANSMLAQRVSSVNSVAAICDATGADVDEVARSIGRDPRIGDKFLKAGIGFGGSCFKKDVLSLAYLAETLGLDEVAEYWRQVIVMNEYSRTRFTRNVVRKLNNTLVGKKITILGYAFKKNTSDTRESPALEIIKFLLEENPREIAIFDPCCNPVLIRDELRRLVKSDDPVLVEDGGPVSVHGNACEACAASDAILVTTEFDEFRDTPLPSPGPALSTGEKRAAADPRPFESYERPTETEVLSLQKFLVDIVEGEATGAGAAATKDPLNRFYDEPKCASDCPDCEMEAEGFRLHEEYKARDRLDWAKIAYHMKPPKWVFDGRGVLDARRLSKLGVRLESVGRPGAC